MGNTVWCRELCSTATMVAGGSFWNVNINNYDENHF